MNAHASPSDKPTVNGALSLRDLLIQAFHTRRIILGCLLAGLALGVIGAVVVPNTFTAESLLLIRPEQDTSAQAQLGGPAALAMPDTLRREIQSDVEIIQSEPVLRATVERMAAGTALSDRQITDAVTDLARDLSVRIEDDSNIIRVAYRDPDRKRAIDTVATLVEAYGEQRAGAYLSGTTRLQQRELQRYQGELASIGDQIQQVRQEAGVLDIAQDIQLASASRDALMQRLNQAEERASAIRGELGAAAAELSRTPTQVLDAQESSNARPNDEALNLLARLRLERQHVAEQYTENWPGLRELDQRIAAAERQVRANSQIRSTSERRVRNPLVTQVSGRTADLRLELQAVTRQADEIRRQMKEAQGRIDKLRAADEQLHDLQRTREVMENVYRQLSLSEAGDRIRNQRVDERTSNVRVLQPATAPERPSSRRLMILLGGIILGVIAAAIAAVIATLLRQEFITPDEAARALDMPIISALPEAGVDLDSPAGRAAVLSLADRLLDTAVDGRPLQVLRVAGDPENRSAMALALGRAIARTHGVRTLLLDVTRDGLLRCRPGENRPAVALPVEDGEVQLCESATPNLYQVRGAGEMPSPRVMRLIVAAGRQAFGRIILVGDDDVQGQLLASHTYALADANLIVVRDNSSRAPVMRRLREAILSAGGDLLGFVYLGRKFRIPERIYRWL